MSLKVTCAMLERITQINRDSSNTNPTYDAAGNMTSTPVRPGSGVSAGQNVALTAVYDS